MENVVNFSDYRAKRKAKVTFGGKTLKTVLNWVKDKAGVLVGFVATGVATVLALQAVAVLKTITMLSTGNLVGLITSYGLITEVFFWLTAAEILVIGAAMAAICYLIVPLLAR